MVDGLLYWHGPGVGVTHQYNKEFKDVPFAKPGTCYTGESTVQQLHKITTCRLCPELL